MPIDAEFIAEVAAHVIVLEQSTPDQIWTRYDRRRAAQAYIEHQMKAGRAVAREHWSLDSDEYDQMLEQVAEAGYRALLSQIRLELARRKAQSQPASSIGARMDSGTIPPQVYEAYHLAYNNITYRAMRAALEEAAEISERSDGQITESFVSDALNLLINASLERCGAVRYQGAEAELRAMLRPLDSRLTGLALRHLANFGRSPLPGRPTPLRQLTEDLNIARADLSASEQEARQEEGSTAQMAAEWLKAAVLLLGAAADLLTDGHSPHFTWRSRAHDKLTMAFFSLKHGLQVALDEHYPLPPKLHDALLQMLELMPPPYTK